MSIAVAVAVALLSFAEPAPEAPALFDLTLERTEKGWSATCARGCAWTEASLTCASECGAVLSQRGMQTQRSPQAPANAFAFVVERSRSGWKATAVGGTAWTELSFGCPAARCVARVTELGVSPR